MEIEMKDKDEFEYDLIGENEPLHDRKYAIHMSCFAILDTINSIIFTENCRSVQFTENIKKLIRKNENSRVVFIDDLVHGKMAIDKLKSIVRQYLHSDKQLIICFRISGNLIDHIAAVIIDCQHNTMNYFDSKAVNPMYDTRFIKDFLDEYQDSLRPINLCALVNSVFLEHKNVEPKMEYNKEQVQSWWDFWSCGLHTLIHIEKIICRADNLHIS